MKNRKTLFWGHRRLWTSAFGILICFGVGVHLHSLSKPSNHRPVTMIMKQRRAQKALNKIGNEDSGEATISYNRENHKLTFYVLNTKFAHNFQNDKGIQQTHEFKKLSTEPKVHKNIIISTSSQVQKQIQADERQNLKEQDQTFAQQFKQQHEQQQKQAAQKAQKQAAQQAKAKHNKQVQQQKKKQQQQKKANKKKK